MNATRKALQAASQTNNDKSQSRDRRRSSEPSLIVLYIFLLWIHHHRFYWCAIESKQDRPATLDWFTWRDLGLHRLIFRRNLDRQPRQRILGSKSRRDTYSLKPADIAMPTRIIFSSCRDVDDQSLASIQRMISSDEVDCSSPATMQPTLDDGEYD